MARAALALAKAALEQLRATPGRCVAYLDLRPGLANKKPATNATMANAKAKRNTGPEVSCCVRESLTGVGITTGGQVGHG